MERFLGEQRTTGTTGIGKKFFTACRGVAVAQDYQIDFDRRRAALDQRGHVPRRERRAIDDAEIVERCMYPLINEGAKILEEGIALRSSDIDIVWIYGYGFPRYRGGPMFYADTVGVDKVYELMAKLYEEQGEWVKPAPLLEKLAKEGKSFKDYADSNRA